MSKKVNIAIDAMGGENAPKKIIEGINISLKTNKDNFFHLYGDEKKIKKEIGKNNLVSKYCNIINTSDIILDDESPLSAAKRGKESSMWKTIESQKENISDISLSAGNTGALLVISRLILNTIDGISKPALAGLWPNQNNMNVVLDLGANVECNEKNLLDFASMGSALFKSLFKNEIPKVALLNIGLEENKGNDTLKKTFSFTIRETFGLLPSQTFAVSTISFESKITLFSNSLNPQLIILSASTALNLVPSMPFKTKINLLLF